MRMGQGVRTGLRHGGITCVLPYRHNFLVSACFSLCLCISVSVSLSLSLSLTMFIVGCIFVFVFSEALRK